MRELIKQGGESKRVSGTSKRANGRTSGPVLQSVFVIILAHSALEEGKGEEGGEEWFIVDHQLAGQCLVVASLLRNLPLVISF